MCSSKAARPKGPVQAIRSRLDRLYGTRLRAYYLKSVHLVRDHTNTNVVLRSRAPISHTSGWSRMSNFSVAGRAVVYNNIQEGKTTMVDVLIEAMVASNKE